MTPALRFPADFVWGAATSAYQIEGSPLADGAGPSIWHRFAHTPGCTDNGDNGDVACDHYRRYADDVALMSALGLRAYRLSLAWARILPEGTGAVNRGGLDFYSRLVDTLLAAGIEPWITLYHWDLPAALDDRGGWRNRDSADWFGDYAAVVFRALGDRVKNWMTLNEPWVCVDGGYVHGVHAPGVRSLPAAARAAHNLLRAHGRAVLAQRAAACGRIGLVVNLEPKDLASDRPEDREAGRLADAWMNRYYLDAACLGRYPEEMATIYGDAWVDWPADDLRLISTPFDFLGVNYYTRSVNRHDPTAWPIPVRPVRQEGAQHTETGWEVHPESFTRVLTWVTERYGRRPIYVTENGAAMPDPPTTSAPLLDDPLRVDYFRTHLAAAHAAIAQGVDLRGYFAWSLLDNCEWASGYAKRFGLYHVDFATQRRTLKASGAFYRDVIAVNGL